MKVTTNWIQLHFPFLSSLLTQAGITGKKKLTIKIETGIVVEHEPFHKDVTRFIGKGEVNGKSFTTGTHPEDIPDDPAPGRLVRQGCYYAILDKLEAYGHRELTIFFNQVDLKKATQELKNQLSEFHLLMATTPP